MVEGKWENDKSSIGKKRMEEFKMGYATLRLSVCIFCTDIE